MSKLYLKSININKSEIPRSEYIHDLFIIRNLKKSDFKNPITIFIKENELGKSILIEAILIKWGFNAESGSMHFNFKTRQTKSNLNKYITMIKGPYRPRDEYFLRSKSLYNVASNIDDLD